MDKPTYRQMASRHFSTYETAKMLGVDMTTVIGWCKQGKMKAFKTPGKHRRIKIEDLITFLKEYEMPIPADLLPFVNFRCLIVDDEAPIRTLVTRIVKQINPKVEVETAADGFEAGRKVTETVPHLVILDLNLPGIDGFKVCEDIRKDDRFAQTKVLAITGLNTDENKKRILKAGANDFLAKPFSNADLKEKIQKVFGDSE